LPSSKKTDRDQTYLLEKIKESLDRLSEKIDMFVNMRKTGGIDRSGYQEESPLDVMTLLSLPDHLRKTAMAICKLDYVTAEEVAKHTGRARAVESGYLNQLVLMGYLKKERRGRKTYFYVEKESR
jgi:hypothetical protein